MIVIEYNQIRSIQIGTKEKKLWNFEIDCQALNNDGTPSFHYTLSYEYFISVSESMIR